MFKDLPNPFTLSALQIQCTFPNSVDSDEMAHDEPSHLDLRCLLFCSCSLTDTLLAIMDMP